MADMEDKVSKQVCDKITEKFEALKTLKPPSDDVRFLREALENEFCSDNSKSADSGNSKESNKTGARRVVEVNIGNKVGAKASEPSTTREEIILKPARPSTYRPQRQLVRIDKDGNEIVTNVIE